MILVTRRRTTADDRLQQSTHPERQSRREAKPLPQGDVPQPLATARQPATQRL